MSDGRPDLDAALGAFERVSANLVKAEQVWAELSGAGSLTTEQHEERVRLFVDLAQSLPAIDGFRVDEIPMSKTEAEMLLFDAGEVGEASAWVHATEAIDAPGLQLREYRHRFERSRRQLVRGRLRELADAMDVIVTAMRVDRSAGVPKSHDHRSQLDDHSAEMARLLGDSTSRPTRWSDLRRHLSFWEDVDRDDIVDNDWPAVKADLERFLYDQFEPIPVDVDDLGALVSTRPTGPVTTELQWARLDAERFERLLFDLVSVEPGYENPNWLMRTNAADSGRDLEVHRLTVDGLSGTRRERIIVQCKHWLTKSIGRDDLVLCVEAITRWEPPRVDVLVVATSGRFSQDAVAWKERREAERDVPRIDLWPDSHLEMLLARRPHMIASYGLRA